MCGGEREEGRSFRGAGGPEEAHMKDKGLLFGIP